MSNTIDLLENIGVSASLRYASRSELTNALQQAEASTALMAAVSTGDTAELANEFGGEEPVYTPQVSQIFWPRDRG